MTVKEIARLAGVSTGTVDRVLYKRGRISDETRAKIETIIEQYQFTPNPLAKSLKRGRPYRFCALLPRGEQDSGYWAEVILGIRASESVVAPLGVEVEIIEYDRYGSGSFEEKAAVILENKPDGLIFAPIMPNRTMIFVAEAQSEGIPFIFIDSDIPQKSNKAGTGGNIKPLCVIAQDSFKSGCFAGRIMHLFTANSPKRLAILNPYGEDFHIASRRDGFLHFAQQAGKSVIVRDYSGYDGTELSQEAVEQFLCEEEGLGGIFVTNSIAHRVAAAAEAVFKTVPSDFFVIGYDLLPENKRYLAKGGISAIISQRPEDQGRQALLNLYRSLVLDQALPHRIPMPIDVYLKENIPSD
jgi:LacI family transcriptional regulator